MPISRPGLPQCNLRQPEGGGLGTILRFNEPSPIAIHKDPLRLPSCYVTICAYFGYTCEDWPRGAGALISNSPSVNAHSLPFSSGKRSRSPRGGGQELRTNPWPPVFPDVPKTYTKRNRSIGRLGGSVNCPNGTAHRIEVCRLNPRLLCCRRLHLGILATKQRLTIRPHYHLWL